jgi:hypothetical protein
MQGKTRSTRHILFTFNLHRVPYPTSHVVYVGNLLLVLTRIKYAPTPRRSLGDRRRTDPTIVLGHLIPPPSRQPWIRGERFQPSGYTATSAYWPISPACDRYGQYLLTGTNPSVLNRHMWELPHRNLRIVTTFSPPFPSECSTGPPKWLRPVSILSNNSLPKWTREGTNPKSREWEPPLDFYRNLICKHSMN